METPQKARSTFHALFGQIQVFSRSINPAGHRLKRFHEKHREIQNAGNPHPIPTNRTPATVCQNSSAPQIVFTGIGGTPPYTFSYKINGGTVQTVNTTTGNCIMNLPIARAVVKQHKKLINYNVYQLLRLHQ